jgi:D-lactate dehydrogenase (cytochrome)
MLSRGTRTTPVAGRLAIDRYACASRAGVGRITQKRWASNKGADSERPFYLQLQESIQERVQKEKAEQLAIQQMQQRTARGQFWATVTGECPRLECYLEEHDVLPSAGVLPTC